MKFRRRPQTVDAEKFIDENSPPRGVSFDGKRHYVRTIQGEKVQVIAGRDWIVDEGDGESFYPIADTVMLDRYERVDDAG